MFHLNLSLEEDLKIPTKEKIANNLKIITVSSPHLSICHLHHPDFVIILWRKAIVSFYDISLLIYTFFVVKEVIVIIESSPVIAL